MLHSCAVHCSTVCASRFFPSHNARLHKGFSSACFHGRKQFDVLRSTKRRIISSKNFKGGMCSTRASGAAAEAEAERSGTGEGPPSYQCLVEFFTPYNKIVILEAAEGAPVHFAGCRVLLLDNSGNVHSIYRRNTAWTGSYWDEFATLPAIIPQGPVGILGLGAGTAARLNLELWPSLKLIGYEIDDVLVHQAREYLGLAALEVPTSEGGVLSVVVDDAFSDSATVDNGFAGIMVDLFAEGEVHPKLLLPETWLSLRGRLRPGGRIMVNCGGACVEKSDSKSDVDNGTWTWEDGAASKDATLAAMAVAFPDQLNCRKMAKEDARNIFALTGDLPDLSTWAAAVPEALKEGILAWKPYR